MPYTAPTPYTGGQYGNTGSYQTSIGNYGNLPSGISNAGTGQYSAYTGAVQPTSLVANQMQGLLASNSPWLSQARASGVNQANSRGLLNSSMAAGNSEASAINAALPIASADANTYSSQQLANQASLNQILGIGMQDDTSRFNSTTAAAASRYATEQNNMGAIARQRESLAYGGEQAGLNRNFQQYMSNLGYQQNLGGAAFGFAGNMMLNNQNFRNQIGQQAMANPFLLNNPAALGGYMDYIGGDYSNNIDNLMNFALGGGQ